MEVFSLTLPSSFFRCRWILVAETRLLQTQGLVLGRLDFAFDLLIRFELTTF